MDGWIQPTEGISTFVILAPTLKMLAFVLPEDQSCTAVFVSHNSTTIIHVAHLATAYFFSPFSAWLIIALAVLHFCCVIISPPDGLSEQSQILHCRLLRVLVIKLGDSMSSSFASELEKKRPVE